MGALLEVREMRHGAEHPPPRSTTSEQPPNVDASRPELYQEEKEAGSSGK